jgi:hypothetical protein
MRENRSSVNFHTCELGLKIALTCSVAGIRKSKSRGEIMQNSTKILMLSLFGPLSFSNTLVVGAKGVPCPNPGYNTIQSAVTAANPTPSKERAWSGRKGDRHD